MPGRLTVLKKAVRLTAAITMIANIMPIHKSAAGDSLVRIPICASGEAAYFVSFEIGGQEAPAPEEDQAACHGPCVCNRKQLSQLKRIASR